MRAFLLVALLAMAATVSCEDFPVSASCNTTSTAVNVNTNVTAAAAAINKTGCTELDVNPTSTQCTQTTGAINCLCSTILNNVGTWQSAVVNASGQACLLELTMQINGTHTENGTVTPITWTITHNNIAFLAFGNTCNTTEISGALLAPSAAAGLAELNADLNSNNVTTGTVWTRASATVSGCGAVYTGVKNIPAYIPSTTPTTAPTQPSGGNGTTTAPTSTVAPTNKPGSSTGGNGASAMTASTFLVAALVAAGIIAA